MIDWHDDPMKFSFALFNLVNMLLSGGFAYFSFQY